MLLTLLILAATANAADLPTYRCTATTQPIVIDGKLDDAAWSRAQWSGDFTNLYGRGAPARPVPPRTRAKFLFDDRCLYLAAEITETDVRAEMKTHDSPLYRENAFELFIDPDDDGQNYLEFEINARNTTFDLLMSKPYSERGKPDEAWEIADMRTAVHVDGTLNDPRDADNNWTVEIAIPWTAMKELTRDALPPKPGARFRMNMARVMVPPPDSGGKTRYATWSPINEASLHVPPRWGWLEFAGASARTPGPASTQPAPKSP
ncbi:MAG: hypothetical protein QOE14_813 [Humisphaera sp.]|nr:hypothetical protein [Humisphaera sp.]